MIKPYKSAEKKSEEVMTLLEAWLIKAGITQEEFSRLDTLEQIKIFRLLVTIQDLEG